MRQQLSSSPAQTTTHITHNEMANAIRFLAIDAVESANSGHPGMPMGMADVATVLFRDVLKYSPKNPSWPNRDRFILSAGHGSMLLYSLLYLTGYPGIDIAEIKRFRQLGAKTAGHPEHGHAAGIETTTGPLGQGVANAVGMALAERIMNARFGDAAVNHFTYTIAGDGCLMEGISHEALSLAGHLKLNKLVVLFDDNGISIDGKTSLAVSEDTLKRIEAYGFNVASINGHDENEILSALKKAQKSDKPSFIACKTTIGYGAPTKSGTEKTHGSPLGKEEAQGTRTKLEWPHAPFEIPANILAVWRETGLSGNLVYEAWLKEFDELDEVKKREFERLHSKELPENFSEALAKLKVEIAEAKPNEATRKSSERALNHFAKILPELIGGSADLTGSNNTKAGSQTAISSDNYGGSYIYYGVREHAMGAIMNALALYETFIPYGGTFLVFSDYCKPAIRLSALMKQRVIYVMTHDSIGLGEDGPTHQPIEHLASMRAIPNLLVFRPADAMETAECWALALTSKESPSLLSLSRQNLRYVRSQAVQENPCARGGYVLKDSQKTGKTLVCLIATGSEVALALEVQEMLEKNGYATRVVSMPCTQLFDEQPKNYREEIIPRDSFKVSIEAGATMCWHKYVGENGLCIGIDSFGASAPIDDLFRNFGFTAEQITTRIEAALTHH